MRCLPRKRTLQKCAPAWCMMVTFAALLIINSLYYRFNEYTPAKPREIEKYNFMKHVTYYEHNTWKNTTLKKILMWTPWFGLYQSWAQGVRAELAGCPARCLFTTDKLELETSDAIYLHASDLWPNSTYVDVPATRRPDQVWVLNSMEPLPHMSGSIPYPINWTFHHRRDADIFSPYGIGSIPIEKKLSNRDYFSEKTMFAATMVSHCDDQAQRYRITYELQKHVNIDVFGKCSSNIPKGCGREVSVRDCGIKFLSKYKFYLAFENSFCRDYISEKFWYAIERRQIPVIAASDFTTELLPPKSFINVFDFPSIKNVAEYMVQVGNDRTLYNSYFDWISSHRTNLTLPHCQVCLNLHANLTPQSYNNIDAWLDDDVCQRNTFFSRLSGTLKRLSFDLGTKWL